MTLSGAVTQNQSLIPDTSTLALAAVLVMTWWFTPSRPVDLQLRINKLRFQSNPTPTRLPNETAVYRAGSHDLPLTRAPPSNAFDADVASLWALITHHMAGPKAEKLILAQVGGGPSLAFDKVLKRLRDIGSGLGSVLGNRKQILIATTSPCVDIDLIILSCLGYGIHAAIPQDPASVLLNDDLSIYGAIVATHDLISPRVRDLPVIVIGPNDSGDDASMNMTLLADLIAMGSDRPTDPQPLTIKDPWINQHLVVEYLAALGGLTGASARNKPEVGQVAVVERALSDPASLILLMYYLAHGVSTQIFGSPTQISASLVQDTKPQYLVLSTEASCTAYVTMTSQLLQKWMARSAGVVKRMLTQQHLRTVQESGLLITWSDMYPHQQWAMSSFRDQVGHPKHILLLNNPHPAAIWDGVIASGAQVLRVWGVPELLGCCCMTLPLTLPGSRHSGTLVGAPLPHCEIMLKTDSEEDAVRRHGKVSVRTSTSFGASDKYKAQNGWVHTQVVGEIDDAGALCLVNTKS